MGIAGLVLGILGVLAAINPFAFWIGLPLGAVALVLGIVGHKAARTEGKPTGAAAAGIALGGVACALSMVMWVTCHMLCSGAKNAFEKGIAEPLKKAMEEAEKKEKAEREQGLPLDREHALKVSAHRLASDHEANSIAFRNRYQDVTLEVNGEVVTVSHSLRGYPILELKGGEVKTKPAKKKHPLDEPDDSDAAGRVKCLLVKSEDAKLDGIHAGDHVTVLGIGHEALSDPAIKGCVFK
jgi:hypothetical protein